MKTRDLVKMGIPEGPSADAAKVILQKAKAAKASMTVIVNDLKKVAAEPAAFSGDAQYGLLATRMLEHAAAHELE